MSTLVSLSPRLPVFDELFVLQQHLINQHDSGVGNDTNSVDSRLSSQLSPSYDRLNTMAVNRGPGLALSVKQTSISDGDYGSREASPVPSMSDMSAMSVLIFGDFFQNHNFCRKDVAAVPKAPVEISVTGLKPMGMGCLHLSVQYFSVRKRLRVNVMKAEGTGDYYGSLILLTSRPTANAEGSEGLPRQMSRLAAAGQVAGANVARRSCRHA